MYPQTKPSMAATLTEETLNRMLQDAVCSVETPSTISENEHNLALAATIELSEKLQPAMKKIQELENEMKENPRRRQKLPIKAYCWTHGFTTNANHTSATCNRPKKGHDTTATGRDRKGGNDNNKPANWN